jgi:hypothetical protein
MSADLRVMPERLDQAIDQAWRRLPHDLAPHQVEGAFRPPLPGSTLDCLLNTVRLETRLSDRIAERLGLVRPTTEDFQDPSARIVLAGRATVEAAIRMSGAIHHRNRIRPLVLKSERAKISAGIGTDAFAAAQQCKADCPPVMTEWTAEELIEACVRDGPICMASWMRVLPRSIAAWMGALVPSLTEGDAPDYPDRETAADAGLGAAAALAADDS